MAATFSRHQVVDRRFLALHEGLVFVLASFLVRWRCTHCERTFRHYPNGVVPFKRYVFVSIAMLCTRYLREPAATYRGVVRGTGPRKCLPIFYEQPEIHAENSEAQKRQECPKALSQVTVWRWMELFEQLSPALRPACERQQPPSGVVDFSPWRIGPWKYRSQRRLQTLIKAAKVLATVVIGRLPTDFGTAYSGP